MTVNLFKMFGLYPLCIALLPVLFLPFSPIGLDLQKGILAALLLGVVLVLATYGVVRSARRPALTAPLLVLAVVPLLLVSIGSAVLNGQFGIAYVGMGFEMGTIGSLVLFCACALIGALANRAHIRLFYTVFIGAVVVVVASAEVMLLLGRSLSDLAFFAWPQMSFSIVAALLAAAVLADTERRIPRLAFGGAALFLAVAFLFFFYPTAALAGGTVLAVVALLQIWAAFAKKRHLPLFVSAVALLLLVLFVSGFRAMSTLPLDVRLTPQITYSVGSSIYLDTLKGSLIGSGPDTFAVVWEEERPSEFNQTPLWESTFREGYSTLLTWLVTFGFLGLFCFLLCPLALLVSTGRALWQGSVALLFDGLFVASALLVFFVYGAAVFYTIDLSLFLLGGVVFGFCGRLLTPAPPSIVERSILSRAVLAVGVFVCGAVFVFVSVHQIAAAYFHGQGIASFNSGEIVQARSLLGRSAELWPTSAYLRDASRASLEKVRQEATGPSADNDATKKGIAETRRLARDAALSAPKDFSVHLSEGSILTTFVIAGVADLYPDAKAALTTAQELSPTRPEIRYLQAVLFSAIGSTTAALAEVQESLRLKSDYEPAVALFKQLQGQ